MYAYIVILVVQMFVFQKLNNANMFTISSDDEPMNSYRNIFDQVKDTIAPNYLGDLNYVNLESSLEDTITDLLSKGYSELHLFCFLNTVQLQILFEMLSDYQVDLSKMNFYFLPLVSDTDINSITSITDFKDNYFKIFHLSPYYNFNPTVEIKEYLKVAYKDETKQLTSKAYYT